MVIRSYCLNKDLTGRTASQFNWSLSEIPHQIYLRIHDGRIINGKSLVGLLSGRFVKDDIIEIVTQTYEEAETVDKIISKLQIAQQI